MITNFDYTEGADGPVLHLMERTNGKAEIRSVTGIVPRFYVPGGQGNERSAFTDARGNPVDVIKLRMPRETYGAREHYLARGVRTFEADRPFEEVALEEAGYRPENLLGEPRRHCYIDIEIDDSVDVPIGEILSRPEATIMCISVIDSFTGKITVFRLGDGGSGKDRVGDYEFTDITFVDERDLLHTFFRHCRYVIFDDYVGWFSSGGTDKFGKGRFRQRSGFDIPYILARSRILGLASTIWSPCDVTKISFDRTDSSYRAQVKLASLIDLLYFGQYSGKLKIKQRSPPDHKLDTIGRLFLGRGKEKRLSSFAKLYSNDPRMAVLYNIRDAVILQELEEKYRIIEDYTSMLRYGIIHLADVIYGTRVIDRFSILKAHERNMVLPTRLYDFSSGITGGPIKKKSGAHVLDVSPSIYDNVATIDVKGQYPGLVRALNVGFETISELGTIRAPNGVRFLATPRSLAASLYDELEGEKTKHRYILAGLSPGTLPFYYYKSCYMSAKILVNSSIGAMGSPSARFFDPDMFNAVTSGGAHCVRKMEEVARRHGYFVVAGDTDSVLVQMPFEECEPLVTEINEEIAKMMSEWGAISKLEVDFERYSKRLIIGVKKRRAEHVIWEDGKKTDYILVRGFEVVRRDASPWMSAIQEELLETILREGSDVAVRKIRKWYREMEEIPLEDLCDWCPIRDPNPGGHSQNIQAVRNSKERFGFDLESLQTPKKLITRDGAFAFTDSTWDLLPDYDHYRSLFKKRLDPLIQIAGEVWPVNRLKGIMSWSGEGVEFVDAEKAIKEKRKRR